MKYSLSCKVKEEFLKKADEIRFLWSERYLIDTLLEINPAARILITLDNPMSD